MLERGKIKDTAKTGLRKNWGILLLALLLELGILMVSGIFSFGIGIIITGGPLALGVYYIYYDVILGKEKDWKKIFKGFKVNFGDSMLLQILLNIIISVSFFLVMIVGIGTLIVSLLSRLMEKVNIGDGYISEHIYDYGAYDNYEIPSMMNFGEIILWPVISIALIVVGIVLLLMYAEARFILMAEPNMSALEVMRKSRFIMKGEKGELFLFDLSFIGWFLLCSLTGGLLLIWVMPYYMSARIMFLSEIYRIKCGPAGEHMGRPSNMWSFSQQNSGETTSQPDVVIKSSAQTKSEQNYTAALQSERGFKQGQNVDAGSQQENRNTVELRTNESVRFEKQPSVCSNCGAKLPEGAVFCGKCGTRQ